MDKIEEYYNYFHNKEGDINEHFPVIKKYAEECEIIYELGVRGIVSTWALLAGHPKKMVSVDIVHPSYFGGDIESVSSICKENNIDYIFVLANSLEIEIEETDLLFIDTIHTCEQVTKELEKHAEKTKKYIIFHDTEIPEMENAVQLFLSKNAIWNLKEVKRNNNGLTVLERKNDNI